MIEFEKTVLYRDLGFFLHYCGCFFKDVTAVSCSASMPYEENTAFLHVLFFVFYCIKMFLLCGVVCGFEAVCRLFEKKCVGCLFIIQKELNDFAGVLKNDEI